MLIITSAQNFTDMDGTAAALAYKELLQKEGNEALAVLPGCLNHSVTESIKSLGLDYLEKLPKTGDFEFVVLDISEPNDIADFVTPERVVEIYDHHPGFEDFWKKRLGEKAKIEKVGAVATQIWEEYKKRGFSKEISVKSSQLLLTAIVSNTLNFNASITSDRDKIAFKELSSFINLPPNWIQEYFKEQEKFVFENVEKALRNDTKVQYVKSLGQEIVISQLELWNGKEFIEKHLLQVEEVLTSFNKPKRFFTLPSISEGINYIYCKDDFLKKLLKEKIGIHFSGDLGRTQKLWLRKEIIAVL